MRQALNYNSAINHTTFMVRSDVLKEVGFYSEHYPVAEDYELFRRILPAVPDRQYSGGFGGSPSLGQRSLAVA